MPNDTSTTQLEALRTMPKRPNADTLLDPAAGTTAIGRHPDGTEAALSLYNGTGAVPTAITGMPGSGVSALLDTLWDAELASGLVTPWSIVVDGRLAGNPRPARSAHTAKAATELLAELREMVLTRAADDVATRSYTYKPTADRPLITVTLAGPARLIDAHEHIGELLESICLFARLSGVSLRSVETPRHAPAGTVGRHLDRGNKVELLTGLPGHTGEPHLPGIGRLTPAFGEAALFRTWPPAPPTGSGHRN